MKCCVFGQITKVCVDTASKQHADDVILTIHAGFNKRRLLLFICTMYVCAFVKQILGNFKLSLGTGYCERGLAVEILQLEVSSSFNKSFDDLKTVALCSKVQWRVLKWTRCVHIRVKASVVLVITVLRVESRLLLRLVFKQ